MKKLKLKSVRAAVIYTRVSSKHQVDGTSLGSQKEACLRYCYDNGLEVEKIFIEEGESAKAIDRTELKNLLEYCRKNKDKISHLIVYSFSRFARNQSDHLLLRKTLGEMGITVKSITEPTEDNAAGMLQEGLLSVINEFDNNVRRDRCVLGTQEKMKSGIWCRKPPIGYMSAKKLGAKEKKMLPDIPNPLKFDMVKKGWELYLTGSYTMADIVVKLNAMGLCMDSGKPMYSQIIQSIFSNKYYCGILVDPWTNEEYHGLHKAMVTREQFDKVQRIMKGKGITSAPKSKANPDFPLAQFVLCDGCIHPFTGSWSTSRNKSRLAYYHCVRKGCTGKNKSVPRLILNESFMEYLEEITPKKEFLDKFEKAVFSTWERKYKEVNEDFLRYEKQLKPLRDYKAKLVEQNGKGILPDEEFTEAFAKVKTEIDMTEMAMHESKIDMFELEETMTYCKHFINDLPRQWFDLGIEGKKRFQKLIFPEGLPYIGNKRFGTAKMSVVFEINQQFKDDETNIVGLAGIEPATKRL